jgi:hypothetical protein
LLADFEDSKYTTNCLTKPKTPPRHPPGYEANPDSAAVSAKEELKEALRSKGVKHSQLDGEAFEIAFALMAEFLK